MTYDEFRKAWVWALRESTLPLLSGEPVDENVSLRAMDRVVKSFVGPFGGQHAAPFHLGGARVPLGCAADREDGLD